MSEPESKLDLTALSDALGDGTGQASVEAKKDEEKKEEQGSIKKTKPATDSPETLSPTSPSGSPPPAPRPAPVPSSIPSTTRPAAVGQEEEEETTATLSPEAQSIKAMFPDFDAETIAAVLAAEGGHQERAINTLLSMSDPNYVAPPPAPTDGQTQSDEQLARSLAMAEQQQQQQHQSQQQQRSFFGNVGQGSQGGFAGLFSGTGAGASSSPQSSSPGYDSSNLTYQPRVRKAPGSSVGGANAANASTTRPPLQSANSAERRYHEGESLVSGWPGPREAKAWQEDLNKLAESSLSRAASTFTALRQRGEQAWAQTRAQQQQQQQQQQPGRQFSSDSSSAAGAAVSPTMGSSRGFDRDASPVGDNELAKILARGREDDGGPRRRATSGDGPRQQQQQQPSVADRYKNVLRKNSSPATASRTGPHTDKSANGYDGEDDNGGSLSWDDAGRTGAAKKTFEPIQIADNSAAKAQPAQRNAVSLMEGSAGRGLTSPRASTAAAAGAGAGAGAAGAAAGAAALAGKKSPDGDHDEGDDDDDDDDLEYVANPFEDED
ncbi:hypothetical protein FA10DRAFT_282342 [Acaromyces ingoldii]|uniref:CUE domain-containing protein n=1 Tax=Acaromyces ingoldii TaxID=215250 RepID=A0A316YTC5_9BASI|nr:hypothetical protein FA10DRAFT_282342 [Acaromyces ingoldii]PWN92657.1 hypothetical protein FA10DRAFT_282342 [Acaromyces ingoldii]